MFTRQVEQADKGIQKPQPQQASWRLRLRSFRLDAEVAAASSPTAQQIADAYRIVGVMFTIPMVFWLVVWVLWAFVWRGGIGFRFLGLALTRADGRKAARWQCGLRALLLWPLALWTAALWLDMWYWSAWPASALDSWVPWLSWGLWWLGAILLPVYALVAALYPRRALHDWMAGTYVVPR
jgi:RDD family